MFYFLRVLCAFFFLYSSAVSYAQNIGINATGNAPDIKAMLDIASTNSGLLIPRMTTVQRDAIASPPNGLHVYNITTTTLDVYRNSRWESVTFTHPATNLVYVYSLADLPGPSGSAITLDANKMYVFSGFVDISPNYLNLNGAGLRGTDPGKDGIMSTVSGGVLRSTGVSVFIENLAVLPASASTKAYDFADATGTKFCNLFSGSSVVEIGIPSLGVGQVSGFKAITTIKNYWYCKDGMKVTGNVGKFASAYNFINGITSGAGIEFLSALTIDDIDLSNNYFIYTGQTGVKVNAGATIDRGRMTTNMFRGVALPTDGFDSYTPAWEMQQNTDLPNSRSYGFSYMNDNVSATNMALLSTYYKLAGTLVATSQKRFTLASNIFTYTGKRTITARIFIVVGGKSPAANADFSIALAKNGTMIANPTSSMGAMASGQGFQITLETEVELATGDYIEVGIKRNNNNATSVTIGDVQFRVRD